MPDTVVLLHGIWMPRLSTWLLARRLRRCGFRTRLFGYPSRRRALPGHGERLARFVRGCEGRVHLVGHSLGGLVILHALRAHPELVAGHIVLLGSPVNGSAVARRLYSRRWSRWLIGDAAALGLLGGGPGWRAQQPLGIVAGTRRIGIGRLVGGLAGDNDGTVAVAETALATATDTATIHTTHLGLLFSRAVARAVCRFLEQGRFENPA
ncbi:MAG: alpha/beta hydrolase [Gammaproteobacteria bacterium]|jgi:pimeloyl-ACP methyl ester carboxylesterase